MRKNVEIVLKYWKNKKPCRRFNSISTDGIYIKSYGTVIVERIDDTKVNLNLKKYSVTTSQQQNSIYYWLKENNYEMVIDGEMKDERIQDINLTDKMDKILQEMF